MPPKPRANKIAFRGSVAHRPDATALLDEPGATVLVHRGVDRSFAILCPDGCGEELTVNLDSRAGPAWRSYVEAGGRVSIYPSVWRTTGCRSHFIVWRSRIYWCDWDDAFERPEERVIQLVRGMLRPEFQTYLQLASKLALVPWEALAACGELAQRGVAERGRGEARDQFRLRR